MKHLFFLVAALICLSACSSKELSKSKAFNLLQKEYPKELYYQVFTADPLHATNLEEKGLVAEGFVTTDKKAQFPQPAVYFTDKAKDLLLPTPRGEEARQIQRVKTGEYHLLEISRVESDERKAAVEYVVEVRQITPFARLARKKLTDKEQRKRTAYFVKSGDKWRMDKSDGLEYLLK